MVALAFIALIGFQNRIYLMEKQSLAVNLMMADYHTPEIPNAIFFLACFASGFLMAYFFSLIYRFKSSKTISDLNGCKETYLKAISALENEINMLKSPTTTSKSGDEGYQPPPVDA